MTAAITRELHRAEAAELARAGDHDAAVRILERLGKDDPETLDLLAKVHAQRGDLVAAEAAWLFLLSRNPDHASALAGTRRIAELNSGTRRSKAPVVIGLAVVVAAASVVLSSPGQDTASEVRFTPPTWSAEPSAPPVVLPDPIGVLMGELAEPAVRLERDGQAVRVVFVEGLFLPDSSGFDARGLRELERWGRLLRGKDVEVTVLGHGVVVADGPTSGGSAVAVARAAAAAQVLARAGERPATSFTLRSADQTESPYQGTDPRNRTVSLLVR